MESRAKLRRVTVCAHTGVHGIVTLNNVNTTVDLVFSGLTLISKSNQDQVPTVLDLGINQSLSKLRLYSYLCCQETRSQQAR